MSLEHDIHTQIDARLQQTPYILNSRLTGGLVAVEEPVAYLMEFCGALTEAVRTLAGEIDRLKDQRM